MKNQNTTQTPSAAADKIAHTPGPWRVNEGNMSLKGDMTVDIFAGETFITGIEGHRDEEKQREGWFSPEVMEANARLIAAAPELLEASKVCLRRLDFLLDNGTGEYSDAYLDLKAAISKAEGK